MINKEVLEVIKTSTIGLIQEIDRTEDPETLKICCKRMIRSNLELIESLNKALEEMQRVATTLEKLMEKQ